ncbi:MAG: glutaredoxin family protein [Reyranellaceae bacterium]
MSGRVIVYSTPLCVPCEALKRRLAARGVAFTTVDLLMDEEAADRLEERGLRSAPVLEVDGQLHAAANLTEDQLDWLLVQP